MPPPKPAIPPQSAPAKLLGTSTIIRKVELVSLVATVTDRRHKFITDLSQKDFQVFEDGQRQRITFFSRQTDLPLRIAMLLDTSNSIRQRLSFEKDAAIDFLYNVIRQNRDMAFLMTFDNEPEVIQDFTGDVSQLASVIQQQRAGGGTALNDAIYAACQKLLRAPPPPGANPEVRRILVVLSDGEDNLSNHALSDAIEMADRTGVAIYAISTNTEWLTVDTGVPQKLHKTSGDKVLEQYADETGGRVFFPFRVDDLAQSFLDIRNELRSQYLIGYPPSNPIADGGYRSIQLRVDRKGLVARTRRGYYALNPAAAPGGASANPVSP